MSELQDMLRVQARLHRKQGANALADLFDNAGKEIESLNEQLESAKNLFAQFYQVLGANDANENALDAALAASDGNFDFELCPYMAEVDIDGLKEQLEKSNESALFYKEQYEKADRECTKLAMREAKANERLNNPQGLQEFICLEQMKDISLLEIHRAHQNLHEENTRLNERVKKAFIDGCEHGHNSTVEGCYGDLEEIADDYAEQLRKEKE